MYKGFPREWLAVLRCNQHGCEGSLRAQGTEDHLIEAAAECVSCGNRFRIEAGILRLLDPARLDGESTRERTMRDQQALKVDHAWEESAWHRLEIEPTLQASAPLDGAKVLELGAGAGRYTVRMAERGARVMATDFSFEALKALAQRVKPGWDIALIEADCTELRMAPDSFDRVASTLVSNLPSIAHRRALYAIAASALHDAGKMVFSTHHYSLRARLARRVRSGHYSSGGIYRYLFTRAELQREVSRYFGGVACRPIQIHLPLSAKLGLQALLSKLSERIWPLNLLGELLIVCAERPAVMAAVPKTRPDCAVGLVAVVVTSLFAAGAPGEESETWRERNEDPRNRYTEGLPMPKRYHLAL